MSRAPRLAALALAGGLALTACNGADGGSAGNADGTPTGTATGSGDGGADGGADGSSSRRDPERSPTTSVEVPEGVTVTDPGARLSFGDTARVIHEVTRPAPERGDERGDERGGKRGDNGGDKRGGKRGGKPARVEVGTVLSITVDSAARGRLSDLAGFNLTDPYQRKAAYYYVRVTVRNVGEKRFGDVDVPLFGIIGENTLLPPVRFTSAFARCPTEPLPRGFAPGARFRTCLVFLSPDNGSLEGVSYRPTETATPIEWRGKVAPPPAKRGSRKADGRS